MAGSKFKSGFRPETVWILVNFRGACRRIRLILKSVVSTRTKDSFQNVLKEQLKLQEFDLFCFLVC